MVQNIYSTIWYKIKLNAIQKEADNNETSFSLSFTVKTKHIYIDKYNKTISIITSIYP